MTLTDHIQPLPDKRLPAAIVAGLLFTGSPAICGNEHLFPERTLLSAADVQKPPRLDADYDITVATVFHDVFAADTVLYADVDNPLGGIRFVGLKQDKADWRIFSLRERVRLLRYAEIAQAERDGDIDTARDYRAEVPARPEDIPLERCEKSLDAALARRIAALWEVMLRTTRYANAEEVQAANKKIAANGGVESMLIDGTAYHFYTKGMTGQTYDPEPGTAPDLLSKLAEAMFQGCADSKMLPALRASTAALENHLAAETAKSP